MFLFSFPLVEVFKKACVAPSTNGTILKLSQGMEYKFQLPALQPCYLETLQTCQAPLPTCPQQSYKPKTLRTFITWIQLSPTHPTPKSKDRIMSILMILCILWVLVFPTQFFLTCFNPPNSCPGHCQCAVHRPSFRHTIYLFRGKQAPSFRIATWTKG